MGEDFITIRVWAKSKQLLRRLSVMRNESNAATIERVLQADWERMLEELSAKKEAIDSPNSDVVD